MLAPEWTWWDAVPVVVAAASLLLVPGGVVAALVGLRPWAAAASASLLTTGIVATGGVVVSLTPARWSITTLAGCVVVSWLLAAAAGWLLGIRRGVASPTGGRRGVEPSRRSAILGLVVASVLAGAVFVTASGRPGNIPQHPDTLFHLSVATRFLERGDISSATVDVAVASDPGFYPAALHGLTSTLAMLTGAPVVVAATSLMLVVAAVVWPLGVIALARALFGPSGLVTWSAAVLSVTFANFPFVVLGWGPLWPTVLGFALVPAWLFLLVLVGDAADAARGFVRGRRPPRVVASLLLVAGLAGLTLAHPNATVTAFVLGWMYLLNATAVHGWKGRPSSRSWWPFVVVLGAGVAGAVAATALAPDGMLAYDWAQKPPFPPALAALAAGFAAVAAVGAYRSPRHWWIVAAVVLTLTVALVRMWGGVAATRWVTWPWYNDTERIRALMVLPVVLAGVAGAIVVSASLRRRTRLSGRGAAAVVGGVLLVVAGSQAVGHEETLGAYYRATGEENWVTPEEIAALRRISAVLPDDAVVAANPLRGANYLNVIGPERVLMPSTRARLAHEDIGLIAASFDIVGESPEVCRAAERWGVTHAIVGGDPFADADSEPWAGIERTPDSSSFAFVTSAGPYSLYERVKCARGPGVG